MPFKNESLHLEETIESIKGQSLKDFEVIAIDDHSDDNSCEILEKICKIDNRFRVFKNTGSGIVDALRMAHTKAYGEFITRQDADDIMPSYKLEELHSLLVKSGKNSISTGKVEYFSRNELKEGFQKYAKWLNNLCENNNHYDQLFKECVIVSSNWLLHRSDFEKLNGFNDSIYPEDYHFVFKLFENNFKIISSDKVTHKWRDHTDRASRNLEQYKDQKFFPLKVKYFKKFYENKKLTLWGAGPTGKKLAKELIKNHINFDWVTNNEKKIGKFIYGIEVKHFKILQDNTEQLLIISVTQRDALKSIKEYLDSINLRDIFEF
jgi:glycosyltransferase involved in cell wall biosynthesis